MKPEDYRLIVTLMLASLLAIVGVQGYSLWQGYQQARGEFDRDVRQAIGDFNTTLEANTAYLSTLSDSTSYDLSKVNSDSSLIFIYSMQPMYMPMKGTVSVPNELRQSRERQAVNFFDQLQKFASPDTSLQEIVVVKTILLCDTCGKSERLQEYYPLKEMLSTELERQGLGLLFEIGLTVQKPEGSMKWTYATADTTALLNSRFQRPFYRNSHRLYIYFPGERNYLLSRITWTALWSILLVALIFGSFWFAFQIIQRQKRLADLKNDFINNMTHEFKTPIATIAFATANIEHEHILHKPELVRNFTKIIREENQRMNSRVEQVLKAAVAERKAFKLEEEEVEIGELLSDLIEPLRMRVETEGGTISLNLNASRDVLMGDRMHLTNVFSNLLDNARKYSPNKAHILVRTESGSDGIWVKVQDHGLGMSREAQRKVFEQFYRVPTGNLHNIKGFGLGLAYAKTIVEQHGGRIEVESKLGEGSTFSVFLPFQPYLNHES